MSDRQRIEQWIKGMERLLAKWSRPDIQRWRKALQEEDRREDRGKRDVVHSG